MILTKILSMLSLLDDTYDNFGTYEEAEVLTEAIQTFDLSALLKHYQRWTSIRRMHT
ncbi:Alpha-copaene synthase [Linum perenne]